MAALMAPCRLTAAEVYGKVELVDGDAKVVGPLGGERTLRLSDIVSEGDVVITGRDGEVHLRTQDDALMALRSGTALRVDSYLARGDATDKAVVTLMHGTVRSITGWIGKANPHACAVRTRFARIAIRGTDHETTVILPPGPGLTAIAAPGTYDKVNYGSTLLGTDRGSVVLHPNQAAFADHEGRIPPRRLEAIPAFYKRTRHELRLEARKESLAREMEADRETRIKEVQDTKAGRTTSPPRLQFIR